MQFDVVVVGSGVAGSVTAYYLTKAGFSVAIINKNDDIRESNTYYAQGGIVFEGIDDNSESRFEDIMKAGAGVCLPDAVRLVSEKGPERVKEILIDEFKVDFNRDIKKSLHLTEEAAHSVRRIIHSEDTTGRSIEETVIDKLEKTKDLTILRDHIAIDIITWNHHSDDILSVYQPPTALGVFALNNKTKKVEKILSEAVVLATGGMGQVYLHTTNPASATGDGYAMAHRAGARLVNMEYTQFHPTTLFHPKARNFLISEAVRGEGAVIVDKNGHAFMSKYHKLKDLAPRDIVTRSILSEMLESGDKNVYLDATIIGKDKILSHFPNIYHTCNEYGIDMTREPIPIVPAFHFSCGGVLTNLVGKTSVKRLFAVGETACTGLHGANRLASTSLLEGVVFGKEIADYIRDHRDYYDSIDFPNILDWVYTGNQEPDPALIKQDWTSLQSIMWHYVGAVRSQKRLRRASVDLKNLQEDIENFYRDAKINRAMIELRNAIQTGLIVAEQAWTQKKSVGTHYRID